MVVIGNLEVPIDFRPMLDAVEPNKLLAVIDRLKDAEVAHAQFAEPA